MNIEGKDMDAESWLGIFINNMNEYREYAIRSLVITGSCMTFDFWIKEKRKLNK